MELDRTDRELLNRIQSRFPLTAEPFASLAEHLDIGEEEVIERIARLKKNEMVRLIGTVMEARRLGYRTTLVAMSLSGDRLEEAARVIGEHPGVSHSYEREHWLNLWFTLAVPPKSDMEAELERLTGPLGAERCFSLPARRLFKINACFDVGGNGETATAGNGQKDTVLASKIELTEKEKAAVNALQQDLPLKPSPFDEMAGETGMSTEDFLALGRSLLERGIVRRYGASLNHRRAGFTANGMACWKVPVDKVDAAGKNLASLREVSHCYERATNEFWEYNLFAMIHGKARETCREIADRATRENGLSDYVLLFSTREFTKKRIKYPV